MRTWLVLIGPPAVGKTTLSNQLKDHFKAKLYSFDKEFPLETLKDSFHDSKECRKQFLDKIMSETSDWIIIDDTCHLKSMQKRYLHASEKIDGILIKVLFFYISARNDQIPELTDRNSKRISNVKSEEIDRITKHLNSTEFEWKNLIEYNFKELPVIEDIVKDLQKAVDDYMERKFEQVSVRDSKSDANFFNQLNLALNKEISSSFKTNNNLDSNNVSIAKKTFLAEINENYGIDDEIDELVLEFRNKHLK